MSFLQELLPLFDEPNFFEHAEGRLALGFAAT